MSMGDALVWILAIAFAGLLLLMAIIVVGVVLRGAIAWLEGYAMAKREAQERRETIAKQQPSASGTIEAP